MVENAHGADKSGQSHWIVCIASLRMSDLIATGSNDGQIKLWHCKDNFKQLKLINSISVSGYVNSLAFTSKGDKLVCALGKEHRLGRWVNMKQEKNAIGIIKLKNA